MAKEPIKASPGPLTAGNGHVHVIRVQREWVKRLQAHADDAQLIYKKAKLQLENATSDLLKLCDPTQPQQGELFAGELLIDPHTGMIRGYRTITDLEYEAQQREMAKKARQSEEQQ